jgi:hypothetical protein
LLAVTPCPDPSTGGRGGKIITTFCRETAALVRFSRGRIEKTKGAKTASTINGLHDLELHKNGLFPFFCGAFMPRFTLPHSSKRLFEKETTPCQQ